MGKRLLSTNQFNTKIAQHTRKSYVSPSDHMT